MTTHRPPYLPSQEINDLRATEALARDERDRRIWAEARCRELEVAAREVLQEWEDNQFFRELDAKMVRLAAVLAAAQTP